MKLRELIVSARSYRRFDASFRIEKDTLESLVEMVRFTPSASNLQPLKYIVSSSPRINEKIFETLKWAGYLKDWGGPDINERPTGYIVILTDMNIKEEADKDVGIVAQTIMLGAVEMGLGGCFIGSIRKNLLREYLSIPNWLKISLVVALGKPAEKVVIEDIEQGESIEYYRDKDMVHHVPKRKLSEILIASY